MNSKNNLFSNSFRVRMNIWDLFVSSFLLLNTLTWYYMMRIALDFLTRAGENDAVFFGAFGLAAILSGVIGTLMVRRIKRDHILLAWIGMGVIASGLSILELAPFLSGLPPNFTLLAIVFGFSFGFGLPSCLSYFADCVTYENRGRKAGILFALATFLVFLYVFVFGGSMFIASVAALSWRIIGLFVILMIKLHQTERKPRKPATFKSVRGDRSYLLFFLPWLMFLLVDSLEAPYTTVLTKRVPGLLGLQTFGDFDAVFKLLVGVVSALVAGFMADRFGRKRVIISGFIALGATFATLTLSSNINAFWYAASGINGIAWGMFYVMFLLVIWGDLSSDNTLREMYFLVGGIPIFFAEFLGSLISPLVTAVSEQNAIAAFPIASFFLFLAVFPLMYAPESLPEKKIKERELKAYLEQAKKTKEKHDQK